METSEKNPRYTVLTIVKLLIHCFRVPGNSKVLTLSQTTNFRLFQIQKILQTTISHWMRMVESFSKKSRKHCGKRRNCSLRAISPFPTVFSKDLYRRHVKTRDCLGKG